MSVKQQGCCQTCNNYWGGDNENAFIPAIGFAVVILMALAMTPAYATTLGTADLISTHYGANQAIDVYGGGLFRSGNLCRGVYVD